MSNAEIVALALGAQAALLAALVFLLGLGANRWQQNWSAFQSQVQQPHDELLQRALAEQPRLQIGAIATAATELVLERGYFSASVRDRASREERNRRYEKALHENAVRADDDAERFKRGAIDRDEYEELLSETAAVRRVHTELIERPGLRQKARTYTDEPELRVGLVILGIIAVLGTLLQIRVGWETFALWAVLGLLGAGIGAEWAAAHTLLDVAQRIDGATRALVLTSLADAELDWPDAVAFDENSKRFLERKQEFLDKGWLGRTLTQLISIELKGIDTRIADARALYPDMPWVMSLHGRLQLFRALWLEHIRRGSGRPLFLEAEQSLKRAVERSENEVVTLVPLARVYEELGNAGEVQRLVGLALARITADPVTAVFRDEPLMAPKVCEWQKPRGFDDEVTNAKRRASENLRDEIRGTRRSPGEAGRMTSP